MNPLSHHDTLRIDADRDWPLFDTLTTRNIESQAQAQLPAHTLMQRAGLAVAQLALAIAPHSQRVWIACGAGNNGGDGLEAAIHLHQWGKEVHLTWLGESSKVPTDSRLAFERFTAAGLVCHEAPPESWDLAIDALLGIGGSRAPEGRMADWLTAMHRHCAPLLQVDLASGLSADTGVWLGAPTERQAPLHTLSLLTLKPGLFTADGRDASGQVWWNPLGVTTESTPSALLQKAQATWPKRLQNSHKGHFGDVVVVGGAPSMTGAALLAGHAALRAGAGRVWVGLLDEASRPSAAAAHPTLMLREAAQILAQMDLRQANVVCGCGGGDAVRQVMPRLLSESESLVIDADGLRALQDPALMTLLQRRAARSRRTVLTPHPLEAALLLGCTAAHVQQDRLHAAQTLATQTQSVVLLKGSGTVVAQTGQWPVINATGSPRLASAGSGDVLAGLIGALMAQGLSAHAAACAGAAHHGSVADHWPDGRAFDAMQLTQRL